MPTETPGMVQDETHLCLMDRAEEGLPPVIETHEIEVGDPSELSGRALLDKSYLLDYAYDEGVLDEDGQTEKALKPCTVRAIIRHAGLTFEEFYSLLDDDEEEG